MTTELPERITAVSMISGGTGSWAATRVFIQENGPDGLVGLFTDTNGEHPDLYRFLDDCMADLGIPLVRLDNDGQTIWDVFRKERMIGNTRLSVCSRALKQRPAREWINAHAESDATVVVGIDWTEEHRLAAVQRSYAPRPVDAPLVRHLELDKDATAAMLADAGIASPALYAQGFAHNNCAGACVRAGQGQWARLLETNPERYAQEEAQEAAFRRDLGKDVAILRDRRGGVTKPLPLSVLRQRHQAAPEQTDMDDLGGCGCMVLPED